MPKGFFRLEFLTAQERLLLGGILIALLWGGIGVLLSSRSRVPAAGDFPSLYRQLAATLEEEAGGEEPLPAPAVSPLEGIPPVYLTRPPAAAGVVRETAPEKMTINQADKEALIKLPGVGPATARRIIAYRRRHGSFSSWKSLKKVKGLGDKKVARLKDYVTFY